MGTPFTPRGSAMANDLASTVHTLQAVIAQDPRSIGFVAPVHHFYGEGTYCRVMQLSEGNVIVGKTHKFDHVVVVLTGEIAVADVSGERGIYGAGQVFESSAGAKRAIIAMSDCAMMTIHPNPSNTRDLAELEAYLISPEDES